MLRTDIQYNRPASFRATATLARGRPLAAAKRRYQRPSSASPRTAVCAASTSRKRTNVLPCLLIAPRRCRPPLLAYDGISLT